METDNKKLMSISEVAKYLGISRYGVIQLIKTNVVKAVDIGKKLIKRIHGRIAKRQLIEWAMV